MTANRKRIMKKSLLAVLLSFAPGLLFADPALTIYNQNFAVVPNVGPTNLSLQSVGGKSVLSFTGYPNVTYRIQESSNFVTWQDIGTNTAANNGSLTFSNSMTRAKRNCISGAPVLKLFS